MVSVDIPDFARRLVLDSAKIKKGEVVWIRFSPHSLELAQFCALEVYKMGGYPILEMKTDSFSKNVLMKVPGKYLEKVPSKVVNIFSNIDALMVLGGEEDPKNLQDVPREKKNASLKGRLPIRRVFIKNRTKICLFLYPTPKMAEAYGVSWEYYHDRVWKASLISPAQLYKRAKPIKEFLKGRDKVRITSPSGTDITFSIKDRGIIICNGEELEENYEVCQYNLNIPAGEVFTTIVEDSAEGLAVFEKVFIDGKPVKNLKLTFKGGEVVGFDAEEGKEAFADFYNSLTPNDKKGAEFGIGINPYIKEVIGCLHTDEKIAGTIHIAIGSSIIYGGKNEAPVHFDMIMQSPTVEVDGDLMMKDGEIVF